MLRRKPSDISNEMQKARTAKTKSARSLYVVAAILVAACLALMLPNTDECQVSYQPDKTVTIGSESLSAELASTNSQRERGLSGRSCIAETQAMLFEFDNADLYGMWMKDMEFAIDIVWLDEHKKVVHVESNVSPDTYPKVFYPHTDAVYVLELQANSAAAKGMTEGTKLSW